MKKKIIIILIVIIILINCLKFIPFGVKEEMMPTTSITLKVPKMSLLESECCMYSATFKSFRSRYMLQKELDNIMNKYKKVSCNNKTYYYDEEKDITISEYGVKQGFIINKFYIVYDKGNYCKEENTIENYYDELTNNYIPIKELPLEYHVDDAIKDNVVVTSLTKVYNANLYQKFMNDYNSKKTTFLRFASSTIEGDIIITDVKYDSKTDKVIVINDSTRDKYSTKSARTIALKEYKNIGIYNDGTNLLLVVYNDDISNFSEVLYLANLNTLELIKID